MGKSPAPRPGFLLALGGVFIFLYHLFFTFDGFNTVFGGDDGMNLLYLHHHWEQPFWRSIVDALQVITPAYRPAGALFYRAMYQTFGFDPLAFRIAIFCMLTINVWFVYLLGRKLEAPRSAAALACLLFSYNAGLMDIEYNTGTIYDILCFLFYIPALILYIRRRSTGAPLRTSDIAPIILLYIAALDSKELAVTLPAAFLLYEILYRLPDFRSRPILLRQSIFLAALSAVTVAYCLTKVHELSTNDLYRPRPSIAFALGSIGHFLELFLYQRPNSYSITGVLLTIALLIALSLAVRSRAALFGALFFFGALIPVALIPHRGGFAAYIAFPGLTLAAGCILDRARTSLVHRLHIDRLQQPIAIGVFLLVALVAGKYHLRVRNRWIDFMHGNQHRISEVLDLMKQSVPDFPSDFRILLTEDAFPPHDWLLFFLTRMRYNDHTVWLDRTRNLDQPADLPSYDLLLSYLPSQIVSVPLRVFGFRCKWEPRARATTAAILAVGSGRSDATSHPSKFAPSAVHSGQNFTLTIPGINGTKIDAVYRILAGAREQVSRPAGWCTLDVYSSCTIAAPKVTRPSTLALDWVRPQNGRWQRIAGTLRIE
jgi:hypothetical protein